MCVCRDQTIIYLSSGIYFFSNFVLFHLPDSVLFFGFDQWQNQSDPCYVRVNSESKCSSK